MFTIPTPASFSFSEPAIPPRHLARSHATPSAQTTLPPIPPDDADPPTRLTSPTCPGDSQHTTHESEKQLIAVNSPPSPPSSRATLKKLLIPSSPSLPLSQTHIHVLRLSISRVVTIPPSPLMFSSEPRRGLISKELKSSEDVKSRGNLLEPTSTSRKSRKLENSQQTPPHKLKRARGKQGKQKLQQETSTNQGGKWYWDKGGRRSSAHDFEGLLDGLRRL